MIFAYFCPIFSENVKKRHFREDLWTFCEVNVKVREGLWSYMKIMWRRREVHKTFIFVHTKDPQILIYAFLPREVGVKMREVHVKICEVYVKVCEGNMKKMW